MPTVTVDPRRCEGKKDCIVVCPERVFAMRPTEPTQPWYIKLKVLAHGGRQAYARDPDRCTACMKCVDACPEKAIRVEP